MASILKFKPRKTALELNGEEIERATVERMKAYEWLRRCNSALAELRLDRERMTRELRRK